MYSKLTIAIPFLITILIGCTEEKSNRAICNLHSEWRDKNSPDSCSYFSTKELCNKLIGKLSIESRLHKSALEDGVFAGGISSRWLQIKEDSIIYYNPNGEIEDQGSCECIDGKIKITWEVGDNLPKEALVYFNAADRVELRYYDYPFSFNTFQYDSIKGQNNPTKIVGIIRE